MGKHRHPWALKQIDTLLEIGKKLRYNVCTITSEQEKQIHRGYIDVAWYFGPLMDKTCYLAAFEIETSKSDWERIRSNSAKVAVLNPFIFAHIFGPTTQLTESERKELIGLHHGHNAYVIDNEKELKKFYSDLEILLSPEKVLAKFSESMPWLRWKIETNLEGFQKKLWEYYWAHVPCVNLVMWMWLVFNSITENLPREVGFYNSEYRTDIPGPPKTNFKLKLKFEFDSNSFLKWLSSKEGKEWCEQKKKINLELFQKDQRAFVFSPLGIYYDNEAFHGCRYPLWEAEKEAILLEHGIKPIWEIKFDKNLPYKIVLARLENEMSLDMIYEAILRSYLQFNKRQPPKEKWPLSSCALKALEQTMLEYLKHTSVEESIQLLYEKKISRFKEVFECIEKSLVHERKDTSKTLLKKLEEIKKKYNEILATPPETYSKFLPLITRREAYNASVSQALKESIMRIGMILPILTTKKQGSKKVSVA